MNDDFQAILKLSHNSNTLILDKVWHIAIATNCLFSFTNYLGKSWQKLGKFGKVAKIIVENINKTVREKLHCNQWRNTSNVID